MLAFFLIMLVLLVTLSLMHLIIFSISQTRHCAFKLNYSGQGWFFTGLPDCLPLAPMAKLILSGLRLMFGIPLTSASAAVKRMNHPCTLHNLCSAMLNMTMKELHSAGGWWALVRSGDLLLVPPLSIIAEFNLDDNFIPEDQQEMKSIWLGKSRGVTQTLSWPAMTGFHVSHDFISSAKDALQFLLDESCCTVTSQQLESDVKAGS